MSCVYFDGEKESKERGRAVYGCRLHERCVREGGDSSIVGCDTCKSRLALDDGAFLENWVDPLVILDRHRQKTDALRNMLAGGSVFLACGGPSANDLPLEELAKRGCWTLSVNNMAGHARLRPQAMLCADPPGKFTHSVWLDKGIMKFVPTPKLRGRRSKLRRKLPSGKFEELDLRVPDCPNVWGFQRHSWLTPDDNYFLSDGACWGNHKKGVEKTGESKVVCTPLLAIRVIRYLGARRLYLVGVDFRMAPDYGYSFPQGRTLGACVSNNEHFRLVNRWLCIMEEGGVFKRFGLEIYNCFERSGLRAFPYVPFGDAVADARGIVEEVPDVSGWYEK